GWQPSSARAPKNPAVKSTARTTRRSRRGRPQAQNVAFQHPVAAQPVEHHCADARHLPEPGLRREEAAPRGVPVVRHLQRPSGDRARLIGIHVTSKSSATATEGGEESHESLLAALGVPLDAELLSLALTHRSYAYENGGLPTNERLEFLGDAVLGLAVTEKLYLAHPDKSEG